MSVSDLIALWSKLGPADMATKVTFSNQKALQQMDEQREFSKYLQGYHNHTLEELSVIKQGANESST